MSTWDTSANPLTWTMAMTDPIIFILASSAMAIGFFAALQLATRGPWRTSPDWPLAVFLCLSALSSLTQLMDMLDGFEARAWLIGVLWTASLFYGPALYAYVHAMTGPSGQDWTLKRVWTLTGPAWLGALVASPFFFLPAPMQLAIYSGENLEAFPGGAMLQLGFVGVFLIVTLAYLTGSIRLLVRHTKTIRALFSNIDNRSLNWLRWLLMVMLLAWVWGALKSGLTVSAPHAAILNIGGALVELAWIVGIGFYGLRQQPIFTQDTASPEVLPEASKYARSALDEARQQSIADRLERIMQDDKVYQDPLLSLTGLAAHVGVTPNHLSQTLNHHLGQSFFDYVNRWRVDDALERIQSSEDSILNIAFDVGFNSRSTFNAAVKKHTGHPPSHFRQKSS